MAKNYISINEKKEVIKSFTDLSETPSPSDILITQNNGNSFNLDLVIPETSCYKYVWTGTTIRPKTFQELSLNASFIQKYKKDKVAKITAKTDSIKANGVLYKNKRFKVTGDSIQYYFKLQYDANSGALDGKYPVLYETLDHSVYNFTDKNDINNFVSTGTTYIYSIEQIGASLISQIMAATTIQQIDSIKDTR